MLWRALLGIALLLGFYAMALGGILACVGLVWVQLQMRYIVPKLLLLTVVLGGSIAWSLLKGLLAFRDGFTPPGPRITARDEPELFAMINDVARELGTFPPERVYLIPDVNAFVAEVGGFLGFGTRRVMGIGVGLLQVDTVQQFKATLAHEYGHFLGGDTRLGAFFYRTRSAIVRSIRALGGGFIAELFLSYLKLFLRVTNKISREQELTADTESVRLAGREAHIEGLRREARGGIFYQIYFKQEVVPLLEAGFRPANMFLGFRQASREMFKNKIDEDIDRALASMDTDPYDTHPALPDRIAFAESLPEGPRESDDRLARSLLADPLRWEKAVSRSFAENIAPEASFKVVRWKDVPGKVYAPQFAQEARSLVEKLRSLDASSTSLLGGARVALRLMAKPQANLNKLAPDLLGQVPASEREKAATGFWIRALWVMLGAHLVERGGAWSTAPGKHFSVLFEGREYPVCAWSREASESAEVAADLEARLERIDRGEDLSAELSEQASQEWVDDEGEPADDRGASA